MANYFSGSDNQKDPSTMHYLKEQLPSSYTETSLIPGSMMMYMNSYADTLAGNSQHSDITPDGEPDSTSSQQQILSSLGGTPIGLHDFSPWRSGGGGGGGVLHGTQILQGQGLSLSLGTQVSPGFQMYRNPSSGGFSALLSGLPSSQLISGEGSGRDRAFTDHDESVSKYPSHGTRALSNSKYLKAAQQLLDEVVNVRVGLKERNSKKESGKDRMDGTSKDGSDPQDSSSNNHELSSAEKQDLQNKLSKLSSMLDEVDSRYKQYYHQMQIVTSSFDLVAGPMAAKPYTALALQTISRHFRCLRDAINVQIMVTRKSLGEHDDSSNSKGPGISRLRYVDQQLRQQKALQHLGMMQQHAWRPQRGLPENAVSILRAWLFEHFLHPYPKDSDKIMLARQTGLTRGQVSNWFINARVRLWKPMVEEMYKEETGEAEVGPTSSSAEMAPKSDTKGSEDRVENTQQSETSTAMEQCFNGQFLNDHQRANNNIDDSHVFPGSHSGYHMSELERFGNVSGVSLTLGLQHCDGGTHHPMSSLGGDHQSFVANVYHPEPSTDLTDTSDFDCLDSGNRQHRFGSSHMLHDFVA